MNLCRQLLSCDRRPIAGHNGLRQAHLNGESQGRVLNGLVQHPHQGLGGRLDGQRHLVKCLEEASMRGGIIGAAGDIRSGGLDIVEELVHDEEEMRSRAGGSGPSRGAGRPKRGA